MKYKQVGGSRQTIPKAWTLKDGSQTGNFDLLSEAVHNDEGWFQCLDYPIIETPTTHKLGQDTLIDNKWQRSAVLMTQEEQDYHVAEQLAIAAAKQREIIEQAYCVAECGNIDININGPNFTYPGGYAAAQIRDDALSLLIRAKARGWLPAEEKAIFYDTNDAPISLTEDEAEQVILRTALKFAADHTKEKVCQKAIDDATTVEEVQAIVWP